MTVSYLLHEAILRSGQAVLLLESGRVTLSSSLFHELIGRGAEELAGLDVAALLQPPPRAGYQQICQLLRDSGPLDVNCTALAEGNSLLVRVEERGRPDSRELAERLQTVLDISRKMASASDIQQIMQEITRASHHLVGANDTTIYGLHADGDRLIPLFTDDPNYSDVTMTFEIPLGTGLTGHVVQTGHAAIVNDPASSGLVVQVPGTPEEVSEVLMSVPLSAGDRVLGAITISRPLERPFSESDLEIISILAGQAAALLAQVELVRRIADSESRYRSLVENAGIGLFRLTMDGVVEAANPYLRRVLGLGQQDLVDSRQIWGSERACQEFLEQLARDGLVVDAHATTLSADGRMLELRVSASHTPGGEAIEGSLADDTDRRRLELENQGRLVFLENLLAQLPVGLVIIEPGGRVRHHNPVFARLLGLPDGEVRGEHVFNRLLRDIPELHALWIQTLRREGGRIEELALPPSLFADSTIKHISATTVPVSNQAGVLTDVVFLLEDVSERRALRNQLIQSQKMDSVGSLASGLAHDFNNILSGILGNTQFLRRQLGHHPEADEPLDTIERSVGMAAQLTRQLLGFARRDNDTLELIDPNPEVTQTLNLFRRGLKPGVRLEEEFSPSLPRILADPLQVGQALLNLLLNAVDATGESGVISVRTRLRQQEAEGAVGGEASIGGPWLEFEIQDTGAGIPEDMLPRVFDPFFTTKAKGQGSGLGLAMVYAILERHGGRVEIQSRVGFGTRIRLLFPIPRAEGAEPSTPARRAGDSPTAQIWVVDDDPVLRDMLWHILESLHYKVRTFETGKEVLEAVRHEPAAADLYFLDVLMPGMSGVELLQELRGLRPDPHVIFCSGYTHSQQGGLLELPGVKGFIEKPFSIASLSTLVAEALR